MPITLSLAAAALLAAAGPGSRVVAPVPNAPPRPLVALVELKGLVDDEARAALDAALRARLADFGFDVQEPSETRVAQEALNGLGLCADAGSVECLVQVGALAKARVVLAGVLTPHDADLALELVGVDVNGMRERGRVRVRVPVADLAARDLALESALTGILRPEQWQGALRIAVAQRGASIYVDGAPRGFAPLSAPIELTPGAHAVFVGLEGFQAFKGTVEVAFREETALDIVLVPGVGEPPPTLAIAMPEGPPAAAPEPAPPRKTPLRVVVYDVDAVGVEPRVARVMGQLLVAEIRKHERVSVLDSSELRALVGGPDDPLDTRGCTAAECFAEVADALGADAVIVSALTNIEGQILFGLRRIDPRAQSVTASYLERVPADDTGALLPLVGPSISGAFADAPLRPGERSGVDERAARVMNPPPLPPIFAGSLYAGAGVSAAAAVGLFATAGTAWLLHDAQLDIATAAAGPDEPDDESEILAPLRTTWAVTSTGGVVALVGAALFGGAALLVGELTDWEGVGATDGGAE